MLSPAKHLIQHVLVLLWLQKSQATFLRLALNSFISIHMSRFDNVSYPKQSQYMLNNSR